MHGEIIHEPGCIYENRAYCDLQQYSCFFTVTSAESPLTPRSTEEEIEAGTRLLRCSLEQLISSIENGKPTTNQRIYLRVRDLAALRAYTS
jgi:hypothetical protein